MPSIIRLRSRCLEEVGEKENACEKETRASPLRAPVLSYVHQAPATQARTLLILSCADHVLLYSEHGQQLRNCIPVIPVGIHLNLINGT